MPEPADELADSPEEARRRTSLREAFAAVPDPRSRFGTQYPLASVLSLVVVASLCGCRNPTQVYLFGRQRPRLLRQLGFRPPVRPRDKADRQTVRSPNEDTIVYVLSRVAPQALVGALAGWINGLLGEGEAVAVDGKALCGTGDHVLTAFAGRLRLAVWQKAVGEKRNELSALEEELEGLLARYPGLGLLTGDAMFCQKEVARRVVEAGRDYLLQLKAPHGTDVAIAGQAFAQIAAAPPHASSGPEKRGVRAAA